ncbi:type II toxin-antitoxin system HicB family antitoxin [Candidatus Poribacteria bacterium]|nr:type II toxin-antitoxin system HicB family antitoxin [Candidatus Poribacteria bacterium]
MRQRYITAAIERADYQKLRDKTYSGTIPDCPGVVAFRETLTECQRELVSVLRDWILVKRRRGVPIPVIDGVDLNEAENG